MIKLVLLFFNFSLYSIEPLPESISLKKIDYSNLDNWATHPKKDKSTLKSKFNSPTNDSRVDVFFIHPTTYLKGKYWNAEITDQELNLRTDSGAIKKQTGLFSEMALVYSPRYRQSIIDVFLKKNKYNQNSLDLAYLDIKNSLLYYLQKYNSNRKFILAGHSQGTKHAVRLLEEEYSLFKDRLILAYLVGMPFDKQKLEIQACKKENDLNCYLSWNTFEWDFYPNNLIEYENTICTNPISFKEDSETVSKELNSGSVNRNFEFMFAKEVDAKCEKNILWIHKPMEKSIIGEDLKENFHILDYYLFYQPIKDNLKIRLKNFQFSK